jgi:hypothetical protein
MNKRIFGILIPANERLAGTENFDLAGNSETNKEFNAKKCFGLNCRL